MRASDFEKSETDGQEVGTRVAFFYQSRGPCARKGGVWTVWRLCALLPRDRYFSGQRRSTRSRPKSDTTVYSKCQSREGRTITGETLGRIRPPARKESVQRLCFQFVDISHIQILAFYGFQHGNSNIGRRQTGGMSRSGPRSGHVGDIRNLRELAPSLLAGLPYSGPCHLFPRGCLL